METRIKFGLYLFSAVLLLQIYSIQVVKAETKPAETKFWVREILVTGDNPLSSEALWKPLVEKFTGEHQGFDGLKLAADRLQNLLYQKGYTAHRVIIPQQTLENGVVKLRIIAFKLGNVSIQKNNYFSKKNILSTLPALIPGTTPASASLSRQLLLANEHPSKSYTVKFRQGQDTQTIDAELEVYDKSPITLFAALNNRSSEGAPDTRLTVGIQQSNLFDRDHILTGTYTTAPDATNEIKQYGLSYGIPFYRSGGSLNVFISSSDVNHGEIDGLFDISGKGHFSGIQYKQYLSRHRKFSHSITFGLNDKLFENDSVFRVIDNENNSSIDYPLGEDVRSRPVSLRYDNQLRHSKALWRFHGSYTTNLSGGSHNNDIAYGIARAGATSKWNKFKASLLIDRALLGRWRIHSRIEAQTSTDALISGEQFGIGGVTTVRGFNEREITGDRGALINFELWAPVLQYGITPYAFIDAGKIKKEVTQSGVSDNESISSIGAGIQGEWKNFSAGIDVAYPLSVNSQGSIKEGDTHVHFRLSWQYGLGE